MDNTLQTFLQIGIVGTALSFVIEVIKNKWGTGSTTTKALTLTLALIIGAAFFFLQGTSIWLAFVGVLAAASTVYAFFFK